jgi:hypothetical protein
MDSARDSGNMMASARWRDCHAQAAFRDSAQKRSALLS